jgi:hypothetical protein
VEGVCGGLGVKSTLEEVLHFEARSLKEYFRKASKTGRGTSQEVADRREGVFTSRLSRYFPPPVTFAKGNIEDIHGQRSQSIDCIMLSPAHPNLIDEDGRRAAILAEGVDFAIEIKPNLTTSRELTRALEQGVSVKNLARERFGVMAEARNEFHQSIPFALAAESSFRKPKTLVEKVVEFYEKNRVPRHRQFDLVLINNRFLAYNLCPLVRGFGIERGIVLAEIGEGSFALFLWFLHTWPKSEMTISSSVLLPYFRLLPKNWTTYHDVNARLAALG